MTTNSATDNTLTTIQAATASFSSKSILNTLIT